MHRVLFFLFASVMAAGAAVAGESLLVGRVERIVVLPKDVPECPSLCPPAVPDARGMTRVCISNDGGCQRTTFEVERVLLGDETAGTKEFSNRTGEFGKLIFPVQRQAILVHVDGERVRWSALFEREGKLYFDIAAFGSDVIAGVPVASLEADDRGQAPLDQLVGRFKH